jgi:DNA-directed RNA polymerase subunit H (RpoH/RPB5)
MERALTICKEMLDQRGYKITYDDGITIEGCNPKCPTDKIIVFASKNLKFNVKNIQNYINTMNDKKIMHAIIIYVEGVTSFTKKAIKQSNDMEFEIFAQEDLQYNITKHRLQSKFRKFNDEESEEFKKKFGTKIPILKLDDPISRFYNFKKGDIIEVERKNGNICHRMIKV